MKIRRYKGYRKAMDAFNSCDLPQLLCGGEIQHHLFHVQHEWDSWEMLFWRLLDGRITQEGVAVWKCAEGCYPPDKPDLEIAMPWREGDFKANIEDIVEAMSEESVIEDAFAYADEPPISAGDGQHRHGEKPQGKLEYENDQ